MRLRASWGAAAAIARTSAAHSQADVERSIAYAKRLKVRALAQASIVQSEPWIPRDRAMIDPLKSLGIEKGKPYERGWRATGCRPIARASSS